MAEQHILRNIKSDFDYQAYCEEHYLVKFTSREDELRICCPNCGDTKFKCYVNNRKKKFNCFKCDFNSGRGGFDVFDLVSVTEGLPRGKAILRLVQLFAPTTPTTVEEIIERAKTTYDDDDDAGVALGIKGITCLPKEAFLLTSTTEHRERKFWAYLLGVRGMTVDEVLACKIHYVPSMKVPIYKVNGVGETKYVGDIGRRIVFPVYGPGGLLVSWLSRPIHGDFTGPKYVNCPNSEISRTLWPLVTPHTDVAVLVEGIIDAVSVRRLGSPFSAYCTFGKSLGYDQMKLLRDLGVKTVILFWDPEEVAAMVRTVENLKMQFDQVFVPCFKEWPAGKDPGNMMTHEGGNLCLEKALCEPVDVHSLEYTVWQVQ